MKLSLDLRATLTQTLTPQQIQYLKLLQLPVVQFEQQVLQEIEQNPMIEPVGESDDYEFSGQDIAHDEKFEYSAEPAFEDNYSGAVDTYTETADYHTDMPPIADVGDPFEFHKLIWQDDGDYVKRQRGAMYDEDDSEPYQIKDQTSFIDDLIQQLRMVILTEEEFILGEQIIGNIDTDGYLRRDLAEIVEETNQYIAEINYENQAEAERNDVQSSNPAWKFALSEESTSLLNRIVTNNPDLSTAGSNSHNGSSKKKSSNGVHIINNVNIEMAEKVLGIIRQLDPPGVGSRNIQECLIAQCKSILEPNQNQKLALRILTETYDAFTKKHYHVIMRQLEINEDVLKEALEVIRRLNPKPGGGDTQTGLNTIIPDFTISKDEESGELIISINDSHIPTIKLSQAYEKLKKETQFKMSNKETKEWIRNKYEDAKFLIQAIRQRKSTMLKVMTSIAHLQEDFFKYGPAALKPLIYKDVAENTGLDISTVCRIVNGKYVQTEFGTFELKFFFSESLPNDEGEEVSTRVIKQIIKDIIDSETKGKPFSDDKIAKELKDKGYNVARRTVAKYREQLRIPVARLRKEL